MDVEDIAERLRIARQKAAAAILGYRSVHDAIDAVDDVATAETDTSKVLSPDGDGGVAWADPSPGGGVSSWDDLTDKPSVFPPEAHTHEPGEVGADPRGMAVAAGAPVGSVVAVSHDFSRTPDGPVHGVLSNGAGTYDPTAWQDGRTVAGEQLDLVLEVAHVADGVLRHRGTRIAAAAVVDLPAGPSHAITLGYVEPTAGPGGGYPTVGMPETGYASTRASFIDATTANGYVAYIQQANDTADHEFVIVRDTATLPDAIAGPWNIGRRLTENDCWTFRRDGSWYSILLNGQTLGRVFDDTWHPDTFDSAGIVFSTGSLWLPGVPWWTLALVGTNSDANTTVYVPSFPSDWDDTPSTVGGALDMLAGTTAPLDDDGLIPDALIPDSIARDSEVASAISSATSGLVSGTDPRLSDARTPLAHTHGIDILQTNDTDTTKVLTPNGLGGFKLSAAPSSGGLWQVISDQVLASNAAAVSFTDLDDWAEIEIRWQGRATPSGEGSAYLNAILNSDTTAVYHRSVMYRMAAFISANEADQAAAWVGRIVGSQSNLDRWSNGIIRLTCNQPSTSRKSVWGEFVCQQSPLAHIAVGQAAGVWANTTSPITTLTLSPAVGEFAAGCRFTLIGRQ